MSEAKMIAFAIEHNAKDAIEMASFLKRCAEERWPEVIQKLRAVRPEMFLRSEE